MKASKENQLSTEWYILKGVFVRPALKNMNFTGSSMSKGLFAQLRKKSILPSYAETFQREAEEMQTSAEKL